MAEMRKLDHVGYVRFASVYHAFGTSPISAKSKLERDLPGDGQLPLLGADVVPFDKNVDRGKKR